MRVDFTPALHDVLHVVPAKDVSFSAALAPHDYSELVADKAKLQLWSNIPASTSANSGGWNAREFELTPTDHGDDAGARSVVLTLSITFPAGVYATYAFTYRILYPSRAVRWLGDWQNDGRIVARAAPVIPVRVRPEQDPVDIEPQPRVWDIVLGPGWRRSCLVNNLDVRTPLSQPTEVARLVDPTAWKVWAFGDSRFLTNAKRASLLILVPLHGPEASIHVFKSSRVVMSVKASGTILSSGNGKIELVRPASSQCMVDTLRSFPSVEILQQEYDMNQKMMQRALLAPWPDETMPKRVLICPVVGPALRSPPFTPPFKIDFRKLVRGLGENGGAYGRTREVAIVATSSLVRFVSHTAPFPLEVEACGSAFSVSPVYSVWGGKERWGVAILSAHILCRVAQVEDGEVSIPAPSPPLDMSSLMAHAKLNQDQSALLPVARPSILRSVMPLGVIAHAKFILKFIFLMVMLLFCVATGQVRDSATKGPREKESNHIREAKVDSGADKAGSDNNRESMAGRPSVLEEVDVPNQTQTPTPAQSPTLKPLPAPSSALPRTIHAELQEDGCVEIAVRVPRNLTFSEHEARCLVKINGHMPECTVRVVENQKDKTPLYLVQCEGDKGARVVISPRAI